MRVLVLANYGMGLYQFRKELLEELISEGHEVYVSLPNDEYVPKLEKLGCEFIETEFSRRGTNPIMDLKLLLTYRKIIKKIKPDVVLTYTIKPNVYGGMTCRMTKTPYLTNITGLGTSIENKGIIRLLTLNLYKYGLANSSCVFFQNDANRSFFIENNIVKENTRLIPGSGVNLDHHQFEKYPSSDENINFLFIGRLMKPKGIDELLKAAKKVKQRFTNVHFDLVGGNEGYNMEVINELSDADIIKYHGQQSDVHLFIKNSHATVLPSYHEGTANVLLESASSGRPVLASNISGCKETFDEGQSGFGFEVKNVNSLIEAITKFINLPYDEKKAMGIAGRKKMEKEFTRSIVINAYKEEMDKAIKKEN
ncbi:glycosyltransferase family 4 protein [Bacillus sp. N1-1]|uniref:glycosyltransferase family 4 protein n=1 Tax=Bacillus sp. N1-1 TaxID=2682541 RepID=UPI003211CDB2